MTHTTKKNWFLTDYRCIEGDVDDRNVETFMVTSGSLITYDHSVWERHLSFDEARVTALNYSREWRGIQFNVISKGVRVLSALHGNLIGLG